MKPRRTAWWALLVGTHAAVFLAARPAGSSSLAGDGAAVSGGANVSAAAPAKASERGRDGRRTKQPSAHAGLLAELNASDLKGADYGKARLAIFRNWIKRDLRGALVAIYGPEAGNRHVTLANELEEDFNRELLARSGQVAGWISSGYFGSRHAEVAFLWAQALVKAGQREMVVAALADLPEGSRVVAIDQLCETAKGPELALLRHWMAPDSQQKLEDYAKRLVRFTGDDLERIFAGEEDSGVQEALCGAYKERFLMDAPPQQAVAALAKLPEEYRLGILSDLAHRGDLECLTGLLAEVDRQGQWQGVSAQHEKVLVASAVESICDDYSLPDDVFRELSGIARPESRLAALRAAGKEMGNPALVADALGALPRGAELDAFILGLTGADHAIDKETWPRLLERVSDPGLKETLEEMRAGAERLEEEPEEGA